MVVRRRPAAHTTFFRDARLRPVGRPQEHVLQLPLRRLQSRKSDFVDVAHDPPPRLGPRPRDTCVEHRLGPNGLKIEKETTHVIVRWSRVAPIA